MEGLKVKPKALFAFAVIDAEVYIRADGFVRRKLGGWRYGDVRSNIPAGPCCTFKLS